MTRLCAVLSGLILTVTAATASAGMIMTLDATATTIVGPGLKPDSDFSIVFDDTGDGLLQLAEVISFSGVSFGFGIVSFDVLDGVAAIPGISTGGTGWDFSQSFGTTVSTDTSVDLWSYALSAAAVPEPSSLALLGAGLLALLIPGRRRAPA